MRIDARKMRLRAIYIYSGEFQKFGGVIVIDSL